MESTNYIRQAIQFAAQEDPTEMQTSIGAALSEKITDAINLKKIEIASNLFSNDINEYITDGGTRRKCDHPDGRRKGNEVEEEEDDVEENIANFGDKKAKPFTKNGDDDDDDEDEIEESGMYVKGKGLIDPKNRGRVKPTSVERERTLPSGGAGSRSSVYKKAVKTYGANDKDVKSLDALYKKRDKTLKQKGNTDRIDKQIGSVEVHFTDSMKKNGKSNNVKENIANFGDKKAKPFTKDDAKNSQAKKKTKNGAKKD